MSEFQEFEKLALEACCNNEAAARFLVGLTEVLHTWDDLIDRDREITDDAIHEAFIKALLVLPTNKFFQQHADSIIPVLTTAIQNWLVANDVERGRNKALPVEAAFIIRSSYVDVVAQVATICGGFSHGLEIAAQVRALAHREGMQRYMSNLSAERKAREGDD